MYKNVIFKFIVSAIVSFLLLKVFAIFAFKYTENPLKIAWQVKSDMSKNFSTASAKNIIIGSSRTLALSPERLEKMTGKKFLNLSAASAKIPYVYYTLKRLVESKQKIETVYIDIPASNNMRAKLKGAFGENFIRYFITTSELQDFSNYYPNSIGYYNERRWYGINYVNKDLIFIVKDFIKYILGKNKNDVVRNRLIKNGGFMYIGNPKTESTKEQAYKYRSIVNTIALKDIPSTQVVYMKKLLKLLENSHINYTFFFSPYPSESKKFVNLGIGNYVNLLNTIPKVNRANKPLILDESFFIDGSHTNKIGSVKFAEYFVQEVLKIDINQTFEIYKINYEKSVNK